VVSLSLHAQAPAPQRTLADVQKALSLVEKPEPVPAKYRTGFDAITARENMAMLTFISSDWMEGRDTASQGYALAADYIASLFKMWGVKPAGDMPTGGGARGGGARGGGAAAAPRERSYFQEITFKETTDVQSSIAIESRIGAGARARTFTAGVDYQGGSGTAESVSGPVVFVGYGISEPSIGFDELQGMDLKGKVVLMLTEAPGRDNPQSPFQTTPALKEKYFPAGGGMAAIGPRGGGGPARFNKVTEITKLGPAAILMVANAGKDTEVYGTLSRVFRPSDDRPIITRTRSRMTIAGDTPSPGGGVSSVAITREIANAILEGTGQTIDALKGRIESSTKPASMEVPARATLATTSKTTLVRGMNVLGMIEGSDPKLKDEYFVIGGHFDHTGRAGDYIYNGADDNGSGSIGVVAIAKAMAANPVKPKRTIVFALWTGEERGLFGSRYYVRNPVFPIAKTVGYLNYDMISRAFDGPLLERAVSQYRVPGTEEMVKKIRGDRYATVSLTADTPFAALTREMNRYVGLDLALRESPLGVGSGGSDHASFASVKVPFVYYMAAMTPDYHQPTDSIEKVNPELFTKIIQMGYLTVFAYADR
jgi:Zn-dependent M28 family amino/carboxypeptidase